MLRLIRLIMVLCLILCVSTPLWASRGITVKTKQGREVGTYKGSYALLIGVSDYTAGWPDLEQIPSELGLVEKVLKAQGFEVKKKINPNADQLQEVIEDFIDQYGYTKDNRLLFYYAGHGHTMDGGRRGYLVPTDAPNPRNDPVEFKRKALDMTQILAWCRQMDAKHALFLFDSCFSGTIFKQRDLPEAPPYITQMTTKPVRQFITAGTAGESVPAKSTFTPAFVDAIQYGLGDLNKDGYISGVELGLYLQGVVPKYSRQSPQYGKIRDYELSRGDFVFQLASSGAALSSRTEPSVLGSGERNRLEEEKARIEKERQELARLKAELERKQRESQREKVEVASIPSKPSNSRPSSSSSNITDRDGVYLAYANGIVRDTKTGLEWKAGPDKSTNWNEARSWVQSLGIDWRMPTMDELEGLYEKGKGDRNMTPLLKTTGWGVWSGETKGSSGARYFNLFYGSRYWDYHDRSYAKRAFAVRSRSDG